MGEILPWKIFLEESKPAAKIIALRSESSRMHKSLQANLDMVDWVLIFSVALFPGTVSITTKSIGDSELRPIWNQKYNFIISRQIIKGRAQLGAASKSIDKFFCWKQINIK